MSFVVLLAFLTLLCVVVGFLASTKSHIEKQISDERSPHHRPPPRITTPPPPRPVDPRVETPPTRPVDPRVETSPRVVTPPRPVDPRVDTPPRVMTPPRVVTPPQQSGDSPTEIPTDSMSKTPSPWSSAAKPRENREIVPQSDGQRQSRQHDVAMVKWKWSLQRVRDDTFDPKTDIDAKRIAATARRYVTRVRRAIAKNYDMDESSSTRSKSATAGGRGAITNNSFDAKIATSNEDVNEEEDDAFDTKSHMYEYVPESREEDDRFNEITLATLDDTAGATEAMAWNNVVISVPSRSGGGATTTVEQPPSLHISTRYSRSTFPTNR